MDNYVLALILSLLPAAGYVIGGLLSEFIKSSQRTLSLSLHGAAGVVLAVVAIELMPLALKAEAPWIIVISFFVGGLLFVILDNGIRLVSSRSGVAAEEVGPLILFVGVSMELFNDGIMVGAGVTVATSLAVILAISQLPGNIPESFATLIAFKNAGLKPHIRFLVSFAFLVPILLGTTLGYFAMRGQPEIVQLSLLSLTAGVLTTLVVEEIVPQAHREQDARLAALIFISSFAGFALLAVLIG